MAKKSVSDYSNDSNLTKAFVWRKKIEKDIHNGVPLVEFSVKAEKRRRIEIMKELEKVKKRREERALHKAQHEERTTLLARERARSEFQDWEKKEDEFDFVQSKLRSEIRLSQGRTKPIDVLCKHFDIEPYTVFKGLTIKEIEELRNDIKMYLDSDKASPTREQYWEALLIICDWELAEARRVTGEDPPASQERGLHLSVEADVRKLLDGKTHSALVELQLGIESKLRSGSAKVVEYWEALLNLIDIYKAKAFLKESHHRDTNHSDAEEGFSLELISEEEEEEEAGSFSPEIMYGEEAIDPEEDKKLLETKRMIVLEKHKKRRLKEEAMISKQAHVEEDNFEFKALKAMGEMEEGDAIFGSNAQVNLDSEVNLWHHDKYRARKPKYLNRVHTGYEWNKYNRTHYDHDNPPPKGVQGYKFNIFYPDLADKIKAPTYTIEKDGTRSSETCMIRFHAGPPYQDIAFRIVNKEWDCSQKKGFKCTFESGIMRLYFNFKRHPYRR